jgi:hypothetical protein
MTSTTKTIFEHHQIRKTKKQKQAFRDYVESVAQQNGYSFHAEKGMFGSNNIIIGDPASAKVVYTAHYDTCPVLPFPNFITPLNFGIYLLYQFALIIPMFIALFLISFTLGFVVGWLDVNPIIALIIEELALFTLIGLMLCGHANKHTANDNTSGVTTLLDLMLRLPEDERNTAAFIFFDNEEKGMFGSSSYHSKHEKEMKNKLLLNFDCVSDGNNLLFAVKKKAAPFIPILEKAFPTNEKFSVQVLSKGVFYPSDQMNFPYGVGVAALKKSKRFSFLYMDRIHTKKDTVYQEENIAYLVDGCLRLQELLNNQTVNQ